MSQPANSTVPAPRRSAADRDELESLTRGARGESIGQTLSKPVTIIAVLLGLSVIGLVYYLQESSSAILLEASEVSYELLPNQGVTAGVPVAIRLGPLTVFEISDPVAGGGGAARAKQVVANVEAAVAQLIETPGRKITIETNAEEQLPTIVQMMSDDTQRFEIIQVTEDDLKLAGTDDAKKVVRVWAERLTDGLKLMQFGEPPKFTLNSDFGAALETLYLEARNANGGLSTAALQEAFEALSDEQKHALTTFPLPEPAEELQGETD